MIRDAGNATQDFLLGAATVLAPREVVTTANCNVCHTEMAFHGEGRKQAGLCVLCHTVGSEDTNEPGTLGGTPGVTIDFKVMIHKIHNARHLPSVLGVTTKPDGTRDYSATPSPLVYADGDEFEDFSDIGFPVWPNLNVAMPRQAGYSLLSSTDPDKVVNTATDPDSLASDGPLLSPRAREDAIRTGVTACDKCHGDPDGTGPLPAPAQGNFAETRPTRLACGSCHDDIDWNRLYIANGQTMPSALLNSTCATCHPQSGDSLSVRDAM